MRRATKPIQIVASARHRNGVGGVPFQVSIFEDAGRRFLSFDFGKNRGFGMVDLDLAAAGDIQYGSNSWRGDQYEKAVREAIDRLGSEERKS